MSKISAADALALPTPERLQISVLQQWAPAA